MPADNTPILIGTGRITQRDPDLKTALGPIDLMVKAAERAAADAGANADLLRKCDCLHMVECITGQYEDRVGLLASRLGMHPTRTMYLETGGNTPQLLVNLTARELAAGKVGLALIAGAEALGSMVAAMIAGVIPDWVERDGAVFAGSVPPATGTADYELPYDVNPPANVYPIFENALRAKYGRSLEEHTRAIGELFSRFSRIAADNPEAWFQTARSAEEIATRTPRNRLVGFPYTKYMNAIIRIDQGACILMTTVGAARKLGIDESRWVYLLGCADANDHWFFSERADLHSSPAMRVAGGHALAMAACTIEDVDFFDLYSCFPSAVQVSRDELGIAQDDPRPLTVTGGLPYHGGPGSNYVNHSIGTMMDKVREKSGTKGLCSGLGWYLTRHSFGIYSCDPPQGEWECVEPAEYQSQIDELPKCEVAVEAAGRATVESYTVVHGREKAEKAIVVGRLDDDRRFLSYTAHDPELYAWMTTEELVGKSGKVTREKGMNVFHFD